MGKLLTFLIGFAVLAYAGYRYLQGAAITGAPDREPPAAALERVQNKADELEQQMKKRAEEAGR